MTLGRVGMCAVTALVALGGGQLAAAEPQEVVAVGEETAAGAEEDEDLSGIASVAPPEAEPESEDSLDGADEPAAVEEPAIQEATILAPQPLPSTTAGPSRASPLARRLAEERGIDISLVPGTGPGGRVVKDDVITFADAAAVEAPAMDEDADEVEVAVGEVEEPVAEVGQPEEEAADEVIEETD